MDHTNPDYERLTAATQAAATPQPEKGQGLSPLADHLLEGVLRPATAAGDDVAWAAVDETRMLEAYRAAEVERKRARAVQEFERTGSKLTKVTGSRPKRRKRELKGLRDLFEPTLTERRGQAREDRRERRARNRAELEVPDQGAGT